MKMELLKFYDLNILKKEYKSALNEIKRNPSMYGDEYNGYQYILDTLVSGNYGIHANKELLEMHEIEIEETENEEDEFEVEIETADELMEELGKQLTNALKINKGQITVGFLDADGSICIFLSLNEDDLN